MSLRNLFKFPKTISVNEVKKLITGKETSAFNLVDVRQPEEYEREHLPGARLIPMGELHERIHELAPEKPTVLYCQVGNRSRSAVSILEDAGFTDVSLLRGGLRTWSGLTVIGPPTLGMAFFTGAGTPAEMLGLAWVLEEGTRRFYTAMAEHFPDSEAQNTFLELAKEEENHQRSIHQMYDEFCSQSDTSPAKRFVQHLPEDESELLIEGQLKMSDIITWAKSGTRFEVLDFSVSMEAKLYDLYIRLREKYSGTYKYDLFTHLANQEKKHLEMFLQLLEKVINTG